jgi:glucose-6-phosphate-specific signal transduction histidine kinase
LYYRIRDISKEHGALNDSYPFVDHLSALIESFHDSQTTVVIKGLSEISWTVFPEIQRVTVYKVIQELLINMKKHSMKKGNIE